MLTPTNPFSPFPREALDGSLTARFEYQVACDPDQIAVRACGRGLTYGALNAHANRIAHSLLAQCGSKPETVALLCSYNESAIIAIWGALKAGKFYTPLDPLNPRERLLELLADSEAALILCDEAHRALAADLLGDARRVLVVDGAELSADETNPALAIAPEAMAAIIYTAGSTGRSKGVMHTQRTLMHLSYSYTHSAHISRDDRHVLFTSLSFGSALWGVYGALLNGARLCMKDLRHEGTHELAHWLDAEGVTIFDAPASLFRHLAGEMNAGDAPSTMRIVSVGGEPMRRSDIELFRSRFRPPTLLRNGMGLTELGSVRCFYVDHTLDFAGNQVPVGYALLDKEILLLDDDGQPVGDERVGEIIVRGVHLSPGYWKRPDLSAEKYSTDPTDPSKRLYRTGDLGYRLPDGCLVHLGRKDFQVKVRGHRIEPSEIEMALLRQAGIREALVVAREDTPGAARLVAYLVADGARRTASDLRASLARTLPDYQIPAAFVWLDAIPLTASAKTDRAALPPPGRARPALAAAYAPPATPLEAQLCDIWLEVLAIEEVGRDDPFLELGGDSLLAAKVAARVVQTLGLEVPQAALLTAATIAQMAVVILSHTLTTLAPEERLAVEAIMDET